MLKLKRLTILHKLGRLPRSSGTKAIIHLRRKRGDCLSPTVLKRLDETSAPDKLKRLPISYKTIRRLPISYQTKWTLLTIYCQLKDLTSHLLSNSYLLQNLSDFITHHLPNSGDCTSSNKIKISTISYKINTLIISFQGIQNTHILTN